MSNAVIAHAPGDAASAVGVCAVSPGAVAFVAQGRLTGSSQRARLMLLWSEHAVSLGALYSEMALAHRGPVVVCRLDSTPADPQLARLDVVTFDGSEVVGRAFRRAMTTAFLEARRRGPVRVRSDGPREADWAFANGVARGLGSSVAMLGLGSLAAIGATDKIDSAQVAEDVLSLFGAPVSAEASPTTIIEENGLPTHEHLRAIVESMQEREAEDRAEIAGRLAEVRRDLAESDVKTSHMLDTLDTLSPHRASWRDPSPAAAPAYVTAAAEDVAPVTLAEAAKLQNDRFAALEDGAATKAGRAG